MSTISLRAGGQMPWPRIISPAHTNSFYNRAAKVPLATIDKFLGMKGLV
jgi:hypothetical protein